MARRQPPTLGKVPTTDLPETPCPHCGMILDCATSSSEEWPAVPKPGDYTICIECLTPAMFTDGMGLRLLTEEEKAKHKDMIERGQKIMLAQIQVNQCTKESYRKH